VTERRFAGDPRRECHARIRADHPDLLSQLSTPCDRIYRVGALKALEFDLARRPKSDTG